MNLPELFRTFIAFAVVLGVLVFVHELGHYLAARWRGVHVEVFSIGFGRPLVSWTDRHGTVWRISWLPLGGFVRLHGQERPEDASEETRAAWQAGRTFHEKSVASRAIVVAAGPIANFLLAIVLFAGLFMVKGLPVAAPRVGEVIPASAAAQAGLQTGDRIEAIDQHPVARFEDIQRLVSARPGAQVDFQINRAGQTQHVPVTLGVREVEGQKIGLLGVAGGAEIRRVGPGQAVVAAVQQTGELSVQMISGLWQIVTGKRGADDLGGPLRIAQISGHVAQMGVDRVIEFIAVLSINLGLINLFPIPVLDGGHLLFYLAEAVRGRPLPVRAQEYGYRAGFAVLAALFLFSTWNDLSHLGAFRWVARLIG